MDIKHALNARAVLTLGKDMVRARAQTARCATAARSLTPPPPFRAAQVFRDLAQA